MGSSLFSWLKMAAVRAYSRFLSRISVCQLARKQSTLLPYLKQSRQFSSIVNRIPQYSTSINREAQFRRCYAAEAEMTLKDLQEQTLDVLKLFDKVDPTKVTMEAHFINDLGLVSLDVVEVVMAFEDEFGCEISDEEAEKIFTVNDAVDLLQKKLDVEA